jgi:hypothetical protein
MLKIIALVFTAVIACTAIGTWAAANSRSHDRAPAAQTTPIKPLELMRASPRNLPHEQYDMH